jgi:leucyl-tRNA synthetase
VEHAILHLIYSRFWTKFMRDLGIIKNDEPAERLFTQGMVIKDGAKMSKSLGNVVSPDDMVARYGADSTRMYTLFAAPPDRDLDWQDAGVEGIHAFLGKVYRFVSRFAAPENPEWNAALPGIQELTASERKVLRKLHQTIKRVTDDFELRWHFNTCVSALMELRNTVQPEMEGGDVRIPVQRSVLRSFVLLLHPFAPFLSHELWEMLGESSELLRESWPEHNPELAKEDQLELPVQINGKLRSRILVAVGAGQDEIKQTAFADEKVTASMDGKQVIKVIVVPGKLINIVVR